MVEKSQINFRVDEQQKEDWEEYVEESNRFSTLSQLIRGSVEAEITDEQSGPSVESPAISSDIQDVKSDIERIRKDVRWLRKQEQDEVDISEIAQDVFDILEPLPDISLSHVPDEIDNTQQFRRQEAAHQVVRPASEDDSRSPQTAQAVADRLGIEPEEVRDAIDHLQDQFLPVVEVELNGQTHYFKEE